MRVVIAAHSGQQGGAELCLDVLLTYLPRERFQTTTMFACEGPIFEAALRRGDWASVVPFSWWLGYERSAWYWRNLLRAPFRIRRLARKLRREAYDLVYTNSAVIFEPAIAARWAGVPHIWHVHEILRSGSWRSWLSLRTICRRIDRWSHTVIFESQAARRVFANVYRPPRDPRVIYNPLRFSPSSGLPQERRKVRAELGLPDDAFVVAWVGQFIPRKQPQLAISAFSRMATARPSFLLMVGDGPMRPALEAELPPDLRPRVKLLGFREDVLPYLLASDVLLLTSCEESFGMVLVEAGACGKPAVATACGGPEEIVRDGVTGFLVPVGDALAIARRLTELANSWDLAEQLGRNAQADVLTRFDPRGYAQAIGAVFEEVVQRDGQRSCQETRRKA